MIAILASNLDREACALVTAWSASGAALLSARDLVRPAWRFCPDNPGGGTAVVNGRRINVADLTGVLTRRPAVLAEELVQIASADRRYVTAEINAFLVAWLAALTCRVANRPTPTSLNTLSLLARRLFEVFIAAMLLAFGALHLMALAVLGK